MVKVLANIPSSTYQKIIQLVNNGEYSDVSQFVIAACENQLALGTEEQGNPVSASHNPASVQQRTAAPTKRRRKTAKAGFSDSFTAGSSAGKIGPAPEAVREAVAFFRMPNSALPQVLEPMPEHTSKWPWGQANRYLPMKLVVRALANLAGTGEWPWILDALDQIKQPAAVIGSALKAADKRFVRKREEKLATALPQLGSEKSEERFASSFLCSVSPTGLFYPGGTFYYGFTAKTDDNRIGLTESGVEFARGLTNYSSSEVERIKGCHTSQIAVRLGRKDYDEVIHRDNLTLLE